MKKNNPVGDNSFSLAIKTVAIYKYPKNEKKEFVMSKQLLRSGTNDSANIRESEYPQSKADFIHKHSIA